MRTKRSLRGVQAIQGTCAALVLAAVVAVPVFAQTTATFTISDGSRTANLSPLVLDATSYSNEDQLTAGQMTLTAEDSSGTGAGWNVTVQASDFTYQGQYDGESIPATNLSIDSLGTPSVIAGESISADTGPFAGAGGSLDVARRVLFAGAGGGKGSYTQELPVSLTIPGGSVAGSYTSDLTVTISAGPGS